MRRRTRGWGEAKGGTPWCGGWARHGVSRREASRKRLGSVSEVSWKWPAPPRATTADTSSPEAGGWGALRRCVPSWRRPKSWVASRPHLGRISASSRLHLGFLSASSRLLSLARELRVGIESALPPPLAGRWEARLLHHQQQGSVGGCSRRAGDGQAYGSQGVSAMGAAERVPARVLVAARACPAPSSPTLGAASHLWAVWRLRLSGLADRRWQTGGGRS